MSVFCSGKKHRETILTIAVTVGDYIQRRTIGSQLYFGEFCEESVPVFYLQQTQSQEVIHSTSNNKPR